VNRAAPDLVKARMNRFRRVWQLRQKETAVLGV
jgi:hypothetical protein